MYSVPVNLVSWSYVCRFGILQRPSSKLRRAFSRNLLWHYSCDNTNQANHIGSILIQMKSNSLTTKSNLKGVQTVQTECIFQYFTTHPKNMVSSVINVPLNRWTILLSVMRWNVVGMRIAWHISGFLMPDSFQNGASTAFDRHARQTLITDIIKLGGVKK